MSAQPERALLVATRGAKRAARRVLKTIKTPAPHDAESATACSTWSGASPHREAELALLINMKASTRTQRRCLRARRCSIRAGACSWRACGRSSATESYPLHVPPIGA